ncbi:MAG: methyl-accepting chemotaxis protein [Thermacetogeniaceae bacterium]|jgi:methyl-accepting chemotaxis protein
MEANDGAAAKNGEKDLLVFDALHVPVFVVDRDGKIVRGNNAFAELVGKKREQLKGTSITSLINSEESGVQRSLSGDSAFIETWATIKDKRYFFEYRPTPTFDSKGDITGVIEVIIDRTGQKLALQAVQELVDKAKAGDLSARARVVAEGDYKALVDGINEILDGFINPLLVAADYIERISKGDIPDHIMEEYSGGFNNIKNMLNNLTEEIKGILSQMGSLTEAVSGGVLTRRGDAEKLHGAYKEIVQGMNGLIDSMANPLGDLTVCLERMAVNDLTKKMSKDYPGVWNELKNAINGTLENVIRVQETVIKIGNGDLSDLKVFKEIGRRCENDQLAPAFIKMMSAIDLLIGEINHMSSEHDAGDIDVVIPIEKLEGAYRTMADSVNKMVDGHIAVMKMTMACVEEIGRGNLEAPLEQFPGKNAFINDTIERLRDNLWNFLAEMNNMSSEHDAGDIDVVIPIEKFEGTYRIMADYINKMVDGHIAVKKKAMACIAEFGRGNFEALLETFPGKKAFINETIEQVRINLKNLITDAEMLHMAAIEGRLSTRADISRHQGDFRRIVQGVNETLDAVVMPVNEASECLREMAKGNLDVEVKGDYMGDHAVIKDNLNATLASLNDIMNQVSVAADQVATGARQVSDSSQYLSQAATESASSLEEITASMHELTSQTNMNAENATQANQLAAQARVSAEKGEEQMSNMVKAMNDINESAASISKIIKAIDEIAFQTNLLALNAAVEAARAGKHGKGFTVVAEEVRNLAQRSAAAAKETAEMIEGSIKKTGVGTRIAEDTSRALEEIVSGATKVTDLIGEIASASKEQAQGIGQINQGLSQVDQVTQQVTASAEESASASEELSSQSLQLKQMLDKFNLRKQGFDMAASGLPEGITPEILSMIRDMILSQQQRKDGTAAAGQSGMQSRPPGGKSPKKNAIRPSDIIALDDSDFGTF